MESGGDTDVQIVRYTHSAQLISLKIAGVEHFYQVKRMIRGIGNMLFSIHSQTSKWARFSAYFDEPLVHMTTPRVALNGPIYCPPSAYFFFVSRLNRNVVEFV